MPDTPAKVVTRFAPSPTGYLHIGGARTALFNWLFARGRGGTFLLRIEDTDRARSTEAATQAIFDGLRWLGLAWDGEAVSQFARAARHREAAEAMVARGGAYRCYASREEIEAARAAAEAAGEPPAFRSPWRDHAGPAPDLPFVIRLKAPREGETVVDDVVQGRVSWRNETLDDMILLRSDGVPTYMHAVVVDDHDMGVTHVIRGDDHLVNAARQSLVYDAMGWAKPVFAHIPLIHGADGAKLSKRHGALGVDAYRDMGFLPEAMLNYLARLSWSHGDAEFFTAAQAADWFTLEAVGRGAARLDLEKLAHVNQLHLRALADDALVERIEAFMAPRRGPLSAEHRARLEALAPALKQRARTLVEAEAVAGFALEARPIALEEKVAAQLDAPTRALLGEVRAALAGAPWEASALQAALGAVAQARGLKLGAVAQPVRAALTGRAASPGALEALIALGRDETLARLDDLTPR